MNRSALALGFAFAVAACGPGSGIARRSDPAVTSAVAEPYVAVVGATLVDVSHAGHTAADIDDSVVVVQGARIVAVGTRASVPIPGQARIIDARGRYVVPGLIDGFGAVRTVGFANAYLYEGVTTVYVAMAPPGGGIDGEEHFISPTKGPSVLTGAPISGYSADGAVPSVHPWTDHKTKDARLDRAALIAAVDAAADGGRRALTVGFDVWPEQLDVIAPEAHKRGLAVTAEVAFSTYPRAVQAGVDAFIRNDKYSLTLSKPEDFLAYSDDPIGLGGRAAYRSICNVDVGSDVVTTFGKTLSAGHTALMPMLSLEATADDVGGPNPWSLRSAVFVTPSELDDPVDPATGARPYLDSHPDRREALRACARRKQAIDGQLHKLGATFLAGSATPSFGVLPGGGLHGELRLLQQIGLTPREALAAATSNFAEVYGWSDRGRLEAGRRADLVILTADPRVDVAATEAIADVMVDGRMVDRQRLLAEARTKRAP